jgi:hypothetical protein
MIEVQISFINSNDTESYNIFFLETTHSRYVQAWLYQSREPTMLPTLPSLWLICWFCNQQWARWTLNKNIMCIIQTSRCTVQLNREMNVKLEKSELCSISLPPSKHLILDAQELKKDVEQSLWLTVHSQHGWPTCISDNLKSGLN